MQKVRLDMLLFERGMVESRSKAQAVIMSGQVSVNGQVVIKPATPVLPDVPLALDNGPRYVSRGGEKLDWALDKFPIMVESCVCADIGSSTGGFTDCLLQHGAAKVYAIDVGKGILHWKIRKNPRVVVMEETNARYVQKLPDPVNLVTIDASFISLKVLLPVVKNWYQPPGSPLPVGMNGQDKGETLIALIKPQFEAGRKETAKGAGVIRDPVVHRAVLLDVCNFAQDNGFSLEGLIRSPLTGPKGNVEFLIWLGLQNETIKNVSMFVDQVVLEGTRLGSFQSK
jgi:23S rRNA (cytidine1920-2'-O)/16S rRNA (cytidine1409-2'-O)-methyltransferase